MATVSDENLQKLLAEVQTESAAVRSMLDTLTPSAPGFAGGSAVPTPRITIPESYQVVVECRDEADQRIRFTNACERRAIDAES